MTSKREEERNEKIIRGLMKLPPNRRCINCNSLGPQYVCTNFWTFVCTTCSGIHREFTHRVKSVSMAKFTSQEVDALQKGGNQRARELFLRAWDQQILRLPNNSNVDKVREFIKNVYVDKKYVHAPEKSSDRPPRDPQSLRSHESENRRASSYHSYSQSPPYDFQYEERRYGKHAPVLTRKPGSDRGLYEGKLSSFLSPTRFGDNASDDRFANEGSFSRASDYSVSSGFDPFKSDVLSPSSQTGSGSPFSETSRDISNDIPGYHNGMHNSDASTRSNRGRIVHPQRTTSLGSFGSTETNSISFKSVSSVGFHEVMPEPGKSTEITHKKSQSSPSLSQSSEFGNLDLFSVSFAPQNTTTTLPGDNAQLPELAQTHTPSVPTVTEKQPPQLPQPSSVDLFAAASQLQYPVSSNGNSSNVVMPDSGGWATFDIPQSVVPVVSEHPTSATMPSSDGITFDKFNPFSLDESSSYQDSIGNDFSEFNNTLWNKSMQHDEATTSKDHLWNAFGDFSGQEPIQNTVKNNVQPSVQSVSDADRSLGIGVFEIMHNGVNVRTGDVSEPPSFSLSSDFSVPLHDFSTVSGAAGVHPLPTDHKPTNPFDLPFDSDMEAENMIWDMSPLQATLPNAQIPASFVDGGSQSWFPQNSGVAFEFDPPRGPMGFIVGQAPSPQMSNIPTPGPVASIGGNPFA